MKTPLRLAKPHIKFADGYNAMVSRSMQVDGSYPASVRIVEKNGGVLEKIATEDGATSIIKCYYVSFRSLSVGRLR